MKLRQQQNSALLAVQNVLFYSKQISLFLFFFLLVFSSDISPHISLFSFFISDDYAAFILFWRFSVAHAARLLSNFALYNRFSFIKHSLQFFVTKLITSSVSVGLTAVIRQPRERKKTSEKLPSFEGNDTKWPILTPANHRDTYISSWPIWNSNDSTCIFLCILCPRD